MVSFASQLEPLDEQNVMLVDSLNLGFRWKHKKQYDFEYDYLRTIESLARSYNCGKVIILADKGHSTYRRAIFPEYKQNRKDKAAQSTEQEQQEFRMFFEEYERTLDRLATKYPVFRYSGVEADDLAGYIVKKNYGGHRWLISSDKDWDLLVNERTSRFSYVTRKETTLDTWDYHYEVSPEQLISLKCLTGDLGDNVPGIKGIGPKTALKLITEYGSALDIYEACPIDSHYKYIQALNENKEQLLVNYELMDLISFCEDAIGEDNLRDFDESLRKYLNDY
jgi:5'-3' exonuclease